VVPVCKIKRGGFLSLLSIYHLWLEVYGLMPGGRKEGLRALYCVCVLASGFSSRIPKFIHSSISHYNLSFPLGEFLNLTKHQQ